MGELARRGMSTVRYESLFKQHHAHMYTHVATHTVYMPGYKTRKFLFNVATTENHSNLTISVTKQQVLVNKRKSMGYQRTTDVTTLLGKPFQNT